jgi:hypothetical protein
MALKVGDVVDDFAFMRPDGSPCKLSDFRRGALLLIFLRHLA